ncbi:type I pantothenate kinase [Sandarakinorhabdus sp. DWP1-3-1]|uniref:type I pantothenate kinase n=1 Tax=Sandarakinorhabdus sp. DWP1-3-1 TaxID=2804627 RepID=UPI003CEE4AFB
MAQPITAADLAGRLAAAARPGDVHVVGLTGSVAAGKSTLANQIADALAPTHRVEVVSTDGWLLPNAVLDARGLTLKKGCPESYDAAALMALPAAIRRGPVTVPGYSHIIYDVDPALARTIEPPDLLVLEGLGFAGPVAGAVDTLVYLDAAEADLEHWFLARFMAFWHAAADDPTSFYARFRNMDEAGARDFGRMVWQTINLPNLREHIAPVAARADVLVAKGRDHMLALVRG